MALFREKRLGGEAGLWVQSHGSGDVVGGLVLGVRFGVLCIRFGVSAATIGVSAVFGIRSLGVMRNAEFGCNAEGCNAEFGVWV